MGNNLKSIQFIIPESLHNQFKSKAAEHGKTMKAVLNEAIHKFLEEDENERNGKKFGK